MDANESQFSDGKLSQWKTAFDNIFLVPCVAGH